MLSYLDYVQSRSMVDKWPYFVTISLESWLKKMLIMDVFVYMGVKNIHIDASDLIKNYGMIESPNRISYSYLSQRKQ
jgi:hypothetical protein